MRSRDSTGESGVATPPSFPVTGDRSSSGQTRYIVTDMAHYEGDRLDLELEDVDELEVRIVAGEVTVTAGSGSSDGGGVRLEVEVLRGPPIEVDLVGGRLLVEHVPEK